MKRKPPSLWKKKLGDPSLATKRSILPSESRSAATTPRPRPSRSMMPASRGHVDESSGVVAKHVVGHSRELARSAYVLPGRDGSWPGGRVRRVPFQIVANVEIEIAVVIEVGPRRAGGVFTRSGKTRPRRDVLKSALSEVAIEGV